MTSSPSEAEVAWLAGIMDGEGCFYARLLNVGRSKNSIGAVECRIELHSVSERMINEVERIYGSLGIVSHRFAPKWYRKSTRPVFRICVRRKAEVLKALTSILPYLRVKDREAKALIAFLREFPEERGYNKRRSEPSARVELIHTLKALKEVA